MPNYENQKVLRVDVSNLSREEILKKVENILNKKLNNKPIEPTGLKDWLKNKMGRAWSTALVPLLVILFLIIVVVLEFLSSLGFWHEF